MRFALSGAMRSNLQIGFCAVVIIAVVDATTEDVCGGHRCDTKACPCGCMCGTDADPGLCLVPKDAAKTLPKFMKAVQANGQGCEGPGWPCVSEKLVPVPMPASGEVLVEVSGSSVNPIDVDLVEPVCKMVPPPLSCSIGTLGNEGAGRVVAVAGDCPDFKVGDEVWGFLRGGYAQYAIASCKTIGLKPRNLTFVDAGTMPLVASTSFQCLEHAGMPSKNGNLSVVITSGQGGTGFMAVQLAKAMGASRVITAASGKGIDFVKSLGADVIVDYHKQELSEVLPDDSVDIVFDNLGAVGTADKMMHAVRKGGSIVVLTGGKGGTISKTPKEGVTQVQDFLVHSKRKLDLIKEFFEAGSLQSRTIQPYYTLSEVRQAFTRSLAHGLLGKISVVPDLTIRSDESGLVQV